MATNNELPHHLLLLALTLFVFVAANPAVLAYDPSPLQDYCVADLNSSVRVNGYVCKNPTNVGADDFFSSALRVGANTNNSLGSGFIPITVTNLAGINTLGISSARTDFAPKGVFPLHIHPRATEVIIVIEGTIVAGFVTTNDFQNNRLFTKILSKGDVFVFPIGLIHFQQNVGRNTTAVVYSAFNSQSPGLIAATANATATAFGSITNPSIPPDVLAKSFGYIAHDIINEELQAKF